MKIKLLNAGGYSHSADLEFPIVIDDDNAFIGNTTVSISSNVLIEAGFTYISHKECISFCLAGHPFGREAIIL